MTDPTLTTGLASESGHWYRADGSPAYEIIGANGRLRGVTLRDAKKMNLFPSVTTVLKLLAKPGLTQWQLNNVALACITLPRLAGEDDTQFVARAIRDAHEQSRKAAALGTLIHEQIERSFVNRTDPQWMPFVRPVRDALDAAFGSRNWQPERSFAHFTGYAGKVDLFARDGDRPIVLDFKTKDLAVGEKWDAVAAYDEHATQLAAYALGLELCADAEPLLVNVFVNSKTPGLVKVWRWPDGTFARERDFFLTLLRLWQIRTNHKPTMNNEVAA